MATIDPTGLVSFLAPKRNEAPIYEEGLHPGVFIVPVLTLLGSIIVFAMALLPFWITVSTLRLPGQPPSSHSTAWFILIPVVPIVLLNIGAFVAVALGYRSSLVTLRPDKLCLKTGFLSRNEAEIGIVDIESVFLQRPLLGRWFGYGTVVVVGRGGTPFNLQWLPEPDRLHRGILELRSPRTPAKSRQPVVPSQAQDDSRYRPK